MPCSLQVTIKLWTMPTCLAPSAVQQKSQDLRPIGTTRSARSRWLVSIGTSGSKIRVIQRRAYGLRDEEYLRLKVLTCMLPVF